MSRIITLLMLAVLSVPFARGQQGNVIFNNRIVSEGIVAPVFDDTLGGTPLNGAEFRAQLYGGPAGTLENQLQPTGAIVNFRTGAAAGYLDVGLDSTRSVPGVASGGSATVQIRAWAAVGGASYEQARTNQVPGNKIGRSNLLTITTPTSLLYPPASLIGLKSFAVQTPTVPSPSISHAPANVSLFWPGDDLTYLVQWPVDASNYGLEYSDTPASDANWQPV